MKNLLSLALFLVVLLAICGRPVTANAMTTMVDVDASQVGGFFSMGSADNEMSFQNYFVGYSTSAGGDVRRSFFHFDLTSVTMPVIAAEFSLTLPSGGLIFGGGDTIEDFGLTAVDLSVPEFSIVDILDPDVDMSTAMDIYDDLGEPTAMIGMVSFDSSIPIVIPPEGLEVVIELTPMGVDHINANLGGEIVLGGFMLDVTPGDPMGEMSELMFGLSDVIAMGGVDGPYDYPFLSLTLAPEPSRALLVMCGLVACVAARRRKV